MNHLKDMNWNNVNSTTLIAAFYPAGAVVMPHLIKNLSNSLPKSLHLASPSSTRRLVPAFATSKLRHSSPVTGVVSDCVIAIYELPRTQAKTRNDDTGPQRRTRLDFIGDLHPGKLFVHDLSRNFDGQFHA